MELLGSLVIAFSMYSRIPMPQVRWTRERMGHVMCFFPLVGLVMGVLLYGFEKAVRALGLGPLFYCAGGTVLPLLVTGGIHMDGFIDVSDARASFGEREKKLEILKDPHTGAFAVIRTGVYLLLYMAVFSEFPREKLPVMGAVYILTRAMSGLSVVAFPKARKDGTAASFSDGAKRGTVAGVMAGYIGAVFLFLAGYGGWQAGIAVGAAAAALYGWYYRVAVKEFGGMTGDLAGWFLQTGELVLMAAAAAAARI